MNLAVTAEDHGVFKGALGNKRVLGEEGWWKKTRPLTRTRTQGFQPIETRARRMAERKICRRGGRAAACGGRDGIFDSGARGAGAGRWMHSVLPGVP